jgi:hypothetical protein
MATVPTGAQTQARPNANMIATDNQAFALRQRYPLARVSDLETVCRYSAPLRVLLAVGDMAEIIDLRPAQAGGYDPIFKVVCEMEGDLRAIDEFADALTLVSETMDESPHANAINRLAWEIKRHGETAEKRRRDLSRLLHPNRSQDR